ncbi:MAG: Fic family protein [Erysipelotrichaceae bacterium]|nr:Fic family protein [Erysipelotrichaceae bacterium]
METRAGSYRENFSGDSAYKSFLPKPLPPYPDLNFDLEMMDLLSKANRSIGTLEGASRHIPNIDLFIAMYVRKEALLSSQIEGTQATMDDILDPALSENTNQNIQDVVNYIKASQYAKERLKELPICNRLIKETHKILVENLRGDEKYPGEFRMSQNWIGPAGSTLRNARYIPPNVEDMIEAMSDLEKFINADDEIEPLIKIALIHYQFETIHPFLDGNGRLGRLLINLFFLEKQVLTYESLYISYYLKRNRIEYYDRLMEVRNKGNYEQWVKFFLLGLIESANDAIETIEKLVQLHESNKRKTNDLASKSKAIPKIFKYLEASPIIDIKKTSEDLGFAYNTIARGVDRLVELKILKQTENVQRNRVFSYEEYLEILRKDT